MPRKPKLRKHKNGQWCTSAGRPSGSPVYFGTNRRKAEQRFRDYLESLNGPPVLCSGRVDDLCKEFLAQLGSDQQTVDQKSWALSKWCNWPFPIGEPGKAIPNGTRLADEVRKADLVEFVRWMQAQPKCWRVGRRRFPTEAAAEAHCLEQHLSGEPPGEIKVEWYATASINHALAAVKMVWQWAVEEDPPLLPRNPLVGVRQLVEVPREPEYFHRNEIARILRYARADRHVEKMRGAPDRPPSRNEFRVWAVLLRFSYHTGLRLSELCRLDWSIVDLEARQIRMRVHKTAKRTGRARIVQLDAAALRMLGRIPHRAGAVFRNRDGREFLAGSLSLRFRRLKRRLGLPENFRLTSMRHTVASDMLRAGESTKMVADLLGHTSTRMVEKVYGHLLDEDYRAAVERREGFRGRHRNQTTG